MGSFYQFQFFLSTKAFDLFFPFKSIILVVKYLCINYFDGFSGSYKFAAFASFMFHKASFNVVSRAHIKTFILTLNDIHIPLIIRVIQISCSLRADAPFGLSPSGREPSGRDLWAKPQGEAFGLSPDIIAKCCEAGRSPSD